MSKRVPAALHAELTEYTNLVRALRTTRTLDLTLHLLHDARDPGWTLWPLIDGAVPEWTLADEIRNLAEYCVAPDSGSDSDRTETRPADTSLVFSTTALLARILALMADLRPSAPGSMQNRLFPMNWQDVICVLAASRIVDPTIVARTGKRLERVYPHSDMNTRVHGARDHIGPSPMVHTVLDRMDKVAAAHARFASLADREDRDGLLAPPILRAPSRVGRKAGQPTSRASGIKTAHRRRPRQRVKTRAIIDTDSGMDT